MLNKALAKNLVLKNLPMGRIEKVIEYNDLFVFQVFFNDPSEGDFDPFYSVNRHTGEFAEFSVLTDGDIGVLTNLFLKARKEE